MKCCDGCVALYLFDGWGVSLDGGRCGEGEVSQDFKELLDP
jgi:hypothetical protein